MRDKNASVSPQAFMREQLGIRQALSESPITVNGYRGYTAVVMGKTSGRQQKIRASVLFVGARAYVFLASAKETGRFAQYDKQFMATVKSFSALNQRDRRLAKELKLALISSSHKKSMRFLAQSSPVTHHAEEQLRLLNGVFPIGNVKVGDLVKIIR
jgi:predicted Zn-dependent protease